MYMILHYTNVCTCTCAYTCTCILCYTDVCIMYVHVHVFYIILMCVHVHSDVRYVSVYRNIDIFVEYRDTILAFGCIDTLEWTV